MHILKWLSTVCCTPFMNGGYNVTTRFTMLETVCCTPFMNGGYNIRCCLVIVCCAPFMNGVYNCPLFCPPDVDVCCTPFMNGIYNNPGIEYYRKGLLYPVYERRLQLHRGDCMLGYRLLYTVYEWWLQLKGREPISLHSLLYPVYERWLQYRFQNKLTLLVCCTPFMNGGYNTSISQLSSRDFQKNVSNPIDF